MDEAENRHDHWSGVDCNKIPVIAVNPFRFLDLGLLRALIKTDALVVCDTRGQPSAGSQALTSLLASGAKRLAIMAGGGLSPSDVPDDLVVVEPGPDYEGRAWSPRTVLAQVTDTAEARRAVESGAAGLIAKGSESGDRVGDCSAFMLLQRLLREFDLPVWAQGGIGPHTAAACVAGGARGVVIDAQLALVKESRLPQDVKQVVSSLDGGETEVIAGYRVFRRPGCVLPAGEAGTSIQSLLGVSDLAEQLPPFGQDVALAAPLAVRYPSAGRLVRRLAEAIGVAVDRARKVAPLAPASALADYHQIRYPILQGPMTRVSDRAAFAEAVAGAGGLPFIALALLRGPACRELLSEVKARLGHRTWGVGILGFVDAELRAEQLAAVEEAHPPVALVAGGRPSQARVLEEKGIKTYLHVPSPGLLKLFLADGARRFVFEGRECGGHVGPRFSFALWEQQLQELTLFPRPEELFVVFAGGIHDTRSAAMIAAMAAPLAAKGAHIGILMGTAYLFTRDAVASGAILQTYQDEALACSRTLLLETAPGHATRCVDTPYVELFRAERQRLEASGAESKAVWEHLERLNLGRLRIASKGVKRAGTDLVEVPESEQRSEGMYMIGDVATMHDRIITAEQLHAQVTEGVADYLDSLSAPNTCDNAAQPLDIAIVGMAGVFPKADDVETYWSNIVNGVNCFSEVDPARWNPKHYYDPDSTNGDKTPTKWGGFLDDIIFDPLDYGIPPQSLTAVDPTQLLSLEVARRALDDAGYGQGDFDRSRVSVIFGAEAGSDISIAYGFRSLYPQYAGELPPELDEHLPRLREDSFPGVLSNVIAGRIANRLDLGGINFSVDAACASSLAALDSAIKELITGGSDMVLCGGADLHNSINDYLLFAGVHALSKEDRCRTFDSEADGTVLGEAVACVVLKRLSDAEKDGDRIYAVIKGIGGASDGRSLGLTAPRKEGQVRAVERAYARSGLTPGDVRLVEAHGTGTVVGDRTELGSLSQIFQSAGVGRGRCALGSVKSQIGHTKCAAGLASLIKIAKSIYHGILPPTLNITHPNPAYEAEASPFTLSDFSRPWIDVGRSAGISSFGFGGANFHALLSAYESSESAASGLEHWPWELILLRGKDRTAALARAKRLLEILSNDFPVKLRDLAATLCIRDSGPVQLAIVAASLDDLKDKLGDLVGGKASEDALIADEDAGSVAFLFSGQGSQRPGMLRDLFIAFPELHALLELGGDLVGSLFPPTAWTKDQVQRQRADITDTRRAQPALGLVELALVRLLKGVGIEPAAVAGHSYGELVALSVAGAFGDEDLLALSRERAEAILEAAGDEPGQMLAVSAAEDQINEALQGIDDVVVANHNAPRQIAVSGPSQAIARAASKLDAAKIPSRVLPVAAAFHSQVVAGASSRLRAYLDGMTIGDLAFAVWSNTTARPYENDAEAIRTTLSEHVASPVRFVEQVEQMHAAGARTFIEVGPGKVLTDLVGKILDGRPHQRIACDTDERSGLHGFLRVVARLAVAGVDVTPDFLFRGRSVVLLDLEHPESLAPAKTAWKINGWLARPINGEPPQNRLRPTVDPVCA
ncbi:MAG: acyltransferase domain-containing protein, partial [Chromatiaceae bacterium]|nr:acyltransferase domain-containing protein [Chromatiaceae bacterium]